MIQTDLQAITMFELPDDATIARATFLALLHDPGETYISAYSLNLQPLFDEIIAADTAGVSIHLLLDHLQSTGHTEAPLLADLVRRLTPGRSDVTICTSSVGGNIWHPKTMIVKATDGGEDHVWTGSVNFTGVGFLEGNIAFLIRNNLISASLIQQIVTQAIWSRQHEPQYQIDPAS